MVQVIIPHILSICCSTDI